VVRRLMPVGSMILPAKRGRCKYSKHLYHLIIELLLTVEWLLSPIRVALAEALVACCLAPTRQRCKVSINLECMPNSYSIK